MNHRRYGQRWSLPLAACVCVVGLTVAPGRAFAYRPFVTEDAGVAGQGVTQLEVSWDHFRWRTGKTDDVLLLVPIHGLTSSLEVSIELPLLLVAPEDGDRVAGLGDIALISKLALLDEGPATPALALRAGVKTPSGEAERGLGSSTWDVGLAAAATKTFEPLTLHAMLGYTIVAGGHGPRQNIYVFGVAADWRLTEALHLAVEVAGNGHPEPRAGPDPITGLLGFIWQLRDKLAIDAGFRYGFNRSVPRWTVTTGLTMGF